MEVAVARHPRFAEIAFTPFTLRDVWSGRVALFYKYCDEYLTLKGIRWLKVDPASRELLEKVHSDEYIDYVISMSQRGRGFLDYGDTPAYPGVYEDACLAVGGTVACVEEALRGRRVCFNPQGGFHHARRGSAAGFCVFNDVALAAVLLYERVGRVAVIDIDAHHGDGTQQILYSKPILKISVHMYAPGFFPGTGYIDELGEGEGYGYSVNVPLPPGSGDDVFEYVLNEVIIPLLNTYRPKALVLQMGVDGHAGDPLAELRYTTQTYVLFAKTIRDYAERSGCIVVGTGGGGYEEDAVARHWLIMLSILAGCNPKMPQLCRLFDTRIGLKSPSSVWAVVKRRVGELVGKLSEIHGL